MIKRIILDSGLDSKIINKINKSIIINYLRNNKLIPRQRISRDLNISASTVSRVIDSLIKDHYVIGKEKMKAIGNKGGKRSTGLIINPEIGYVIGIDLGKEKMKANISNIDGSFIKDYTGFNVVDDKIIIQKLSKEIKRILSDFKSPSFKLRAICIGIPARVDINSGKIIAATYYKNWNDLDLKGTLTDEFKIPIYIENDSNLSALAEKNFGEGKGFSDILYIEISKGIGSGIILDNHLYRSYRGFAGELGFSIPSVEGLGYSDKNQGYLENKVSVYSLKCEAIKGIKIGKKSLITELVKNNLDKIDARIIYEAAKLGDSFAIGLIERSIKYLSIVLGNAILMLSPQIVIIGGEVCSLPYVEDLLLVPLKDNIKRVVPFDMPKITTASLKESSTRIGASFLAMESFFTSEFPFWISGKGYLNS